MHAQIRSLIGDPMVSLKVETCMGSGDIRFILLTKSGTM